VKFPPHIFFRCVYLCFSRLDFFERLWIDFRKRLRWATTESISEMVPTSWCIAPPADNAKTTRAIHVTHLLIAVA